MPIDHSRNEESGDDSAASVLTMLKLTEIRAARSSEYFIAVSHETVRGLFVYKLVPLEANR
jgi:hypothetical protein